MPTRGGERERGDAVADRQHRQLVAGEELLDQHRLLAEAALDEHRLQRGPGLRLVGRDHHALARRQAVGLDHRRVAVHGGQSVRHGLDDRVVGGRDAGRPHDLLGERLRALQAGRGGRRAEAGQPRAGARVGQARHQRGLRAGDHQLHAGVGGGGGEPLDVRRVGAGQHHGVARDAGVAGRAQQLRRLRGARQRPHDRVLAPPGADDQDPHGSDPFLQPNEARGLTPFCSEMKRGV